MKYLSLLALVFTGIVMAGCANDITAYHDIYRAQYKYKAPVEAAPATAAPAVAPAQ